MCVTQDAAKKAEEIIGDMVRTLASATATIEPGRSLLISFLGWLLSVSFLG